MFARRWLIAEDGDAATVLEAAQLGSYESLRFALFRGSRSELPLTLTMKATIKAWMTAVKLACPSYGGFSPSTPIWMNPTLPQFYNLPDPMIWAVKGIKTLRDITYFGELQTFSQLQSRHDLPNTYLFRFLQIRHAFQEQFRELKVESLPSSLESLLVDGDLVKPLSVAYKEFFKSTPPAITKCREKWEMEVPEIQGEDWDELWMQPFRHLVSARDRLIQFKFLHRSYLTPARLHKIFPTVSAECWRCSHVTADTDHIFWRCPKIQEFWTDVTSCITELISVPIPMNIKVCLLGLVDDIVPTRAMRTLLNILMFYGRKAILLAWKKPEAPTISVWKGLVNSMLPFYKATYESRGCVKKFDRVWQAWYKSNTTVG